MKKQKETTQEQSTEAGLLEKLGIELDVLGLLFMAANIFATVANIRATALNTRAINLNTEAALKSGSQSHVISARKKGKPKQRPKKL
ncbi:hypothetical protein CIG75_15590 [Tumebacillus algifaecis]|uniref:Uncharacterized protein n=1 Tax=Tumebacillus algifaecis TaxID=1214604 RepID=A0A223D3N0_9BACL|nr:hypothetical protein [Tumebacillus algifaecis]ASS76222.1 hypothetical protein CIG75_15590 [Tumebacillus algifaecis]